MKTLPIILAVLLVAAGRAPASTAYQALEVLKNAKGEAILKQLVEVRGETGHPQPQSWTILMTDAAARGGVREFVVTDGEIASERTPIQGYASGTGALPVINFGRLNVDSDQAFKYANKQAVDSQVGFNTVDYTLRTAGADGAPVWEIRLFDYMGAPVGSLSVSAETGKELTAFHIDPDARQKPVAAATPKPPSKPRQTASEPTPESTPVFKGGVFGFVESTSKKVGRTVKKTTLNVVGTVQEALTGERTIGEDDGSSGE